MNFFIPCRILQSLLTRCKLREIFGLSDKEANDSVHLGTEIGGQMVATVFTQFGLHLASGQPVAIRRTKTDRHVYSFHSLTAKVASPSSSPPQLPSGRPLAIDSGEFE